MKQVFILLLSLSAFADDRLEIIKIGHPTLRTLATEVDMATFADPKFQKRVDNMITTMETAGGVGLAAPLTVVVNPKIEHLEEAGKKDSVEGCL